MGDFNAKLNSTCLRSRDRLYGKLLTDCNMCAVNSLPSCFGRDNTFVSYDNQYTSMIYYVCIPVVFIDLVVHFVVLFECIQTSTDSILSELCCSQVRVPGTFLQY